MKQFSLLSVYRDKARGEDWRVEVVRASGEHSVALFSGDEAKLRALDYAVWLSQTQRSTGGTA